MRKFHQIFWVALPTLLYGLFWTFWSFVLLRPVPVVGKFLWNSGLALKKIMPNLPNPHDQFIYFPIASRWWDVALAPIGALVLVLLYYNKKFNDELLAYEDINFSWGKLVRDITNPFTKPFFILKEFIDEKQSAWAHKRVMGMLSDNDYPLEDDAHMAEFQKSLDITRARTERILREMEADRMKEMDMTGIKTWKAYCLVICIFFGIFFGILVGPAKGPFGFFGLQPAIGCLMGPLMLLNRRWQIAVITHMACWVGLSYGFSVGIGMIPALCWTSYIFVPTGLVIALVCYFRSRPKSQIAPALL